MVFWGMNEVPGGKRWRYFTEPRSFSDTLTALESAVCGIWYAHATESTIMCTVCFELRKVLQQQHIDFDNFDVVDACFMRLFPAVYADVIASGQLQALQLPAHTRAFERELNLHEAEHAQDDDIDLYDEVMGEDL